MYSCRYVCCQVINSHTSLHIVGVHIMNHLIEPKA